MALYCVQLLTCIVVMRAGRASRLGQQRFIPLGSHQGAPKPLHLAGRTDNRITTVSICSNSQHRPGHQGDAGRWEKRCETAD